MLGWLRLLLLWRQSRQTLPRSNIEHTYVQVHSSPSRKFVRFEKGFVLAFFRQCRPGVLLLDAAKQLKMGSVCKVVRSDVFSSAVQQTLRAVVLRESGKHYTFWHEEKSSNNFSSQWGSRRRYLNDITNLKEHLLNVKKKSGIVSTLRACFLACDKRHYLVSALHATHRASIDFTHSAISGRAYFQIW